MTTDKSWMQNEWNDDLKHFEDNDSGLRHAKAYNPANPALVDEIDEANGQLITAITAALDEVNAGRCVEAGITLRMALGEYKARLGKIPAHLAEMWESERETGETK